MQNNELRGWIKGILAMAAAALTGAAALHYSTWLAAGLAAMVLLASVPLESMRGK